MGETPPEWKSGCFQRGGRLSLPVFLNSESDTCTLTGIRRVGGGAVEESGRASQVCHAGVVSVAVHGAGN